MQQRIDTYFGNLARLIRETEVTDVIGTRRSMEQGFLMVQKAAHAANDSGNKIMFIGNGGSAGIASHMAIDFSKNGKLRSMTFNDPAALTCLSNDLGYDRVFAEQIAFHARPGDVLIAISSSGRSANILLGVAAARERRCRIVTFSGFDENNDLRRTGEVNFYVRSHEYGFVEIAHLSLCHAILDLGTGWADSFSATAR